MKKRYHILDSLTRIGDVSRIEEVLLRRNLAISIDAKAVDDTKRARHGIDVAQKLDRHRRQLLVDVGVNELDPRDEIRQRRPPLLLEIVSTYQWDCASTRAEGCSKFDRFNVGDAVEITPSEACYIVTS